MIAINGRIQREGDVVHLVARAARSVGDLSGLSPTEDNKFQISDGTGG